MYLPCLYVFNLYKPSQPHPIYLHVTSLWPPHDLHLTSDNFNKKGWFAYYPCLTTQWTQPLIPPPFIQKFCLLNQAIICYEKKQKSGLFCSYKTKHLKTNQNYGVWHPPFSFLLSPPTYPCIPLPIHTNPPLTNPSHPLPTLMSSLSPLLTPPTPHSNQPVCLLDLTSPYTPLTSHCINHHVLRRILSGSCKHLKKSKILEHFICLMGTMYLYLQLR